MDPDATLEAISNLLRRSASDSEAGEELDIACQGLFDWLAKGGFAPDWSKYESASGYYQCRAVHHSRGERV
jgi:hypothetical protein